jgi:hypothetical protein
MDYMQIITPLTDEPAALESAFRRSIEEKQSAEFQAAIESLYEKEPENRLLAAWHFRLTFDGLPAAVRSATNWALVISLSIASGLVLWLVSDENFTIVDPFPAFFQLWGPVVVLFILAYFAIEDRGVRSRAVWSGGLLVLAAAYGLWAANREFTFASQYADLLLIHLPALSWTAVGVALLGLRSAAAGRFVFLRKSLEMFVTGGLYLGAGMIFGGVTIGLFASLQVNFPEIVIRLIAAGGAGLIPLIAVASVYEAGLPPERQTVGQGVGKLVPILTQLLLPLSLVVLVIFIFFIPFNFMAPFQDRDVLIVYNVLLFGIMGLLLGVTPVQESDISARLRPWIRRGVIALAGLTALISLYALAAVVTRTVQGGWTINRVTVIGWNSINIGLLLYIVLRLLRSAPSAWASGLKEVFKLGSVLYVAWVLVGLVLFPLVF